MKKLPLILAVITVLIGGGLRISMFGESGKDFSVYIEAVREYSEGINPYANTVKSFDDPENTADHGFSYLPGFLFLFLPFHLVAKNSEEFAILCKIPVLLADLGICIILFKELYKHSNWAAFFAVLLWIFNPYFVLKWNFIYMDPIPVFFMLLGLALLEKKNTASAIFYSLSCIFKTFPVILFPIFLFKVRNKLKFVLLALIPLILVSLPFLHDPLTYLKGAFLVHADRAVQGKPFLYTLSYKLRLELIRTVPLKIYTFLATFGGWLLIAINEILKGRGKGLRFESKYIYGFLSFSIFYFFTPVLNKTYLLWVMPVAILASFDLIKEKKWPIWAFFALTSVFYLFYLYYLLIWNQGLHVDYKYY